MTNEIMGFGGLDIGALRAGLQNVRRTARDTGGTPFLRLLKDGNWALGADDAEVEAGTRAIVNPASVKHGFSCWTNRQPGEGKNVLMGEVMVSAMSDKPLPHQLEQHVDDKTGAPCKWSEQHAIDLRFIDGEVKGTQAAYKTTAVGGIRAVMGVIDALVERLVDTNGETAYLCPVVELASDSYKHSTYGKTYTPVIKVVGWADAQGSIEGKAQRIAKAPDADADPDDAPEEEGLRRRRRG